MASNLDYTEIKSGVFFKIDGTVYETIESTFSKKSRQKGSNQVKIKNLTTGSVVSKTLHSSDKIKSVDIEKADFVFIYLKGDKAIIHPENKPSERKEISSASIPGVSFLPTNTKVSALIENNEVLTISPPIKVNLKIKEAPPSIRGNTAQGGSKHILLETGATINVPLFIETGDTIQVNTQTGEYTERVQKS